jgi:hypothetical protein
MSLELKLLIRSNNDITGADAPSTGLVQVKVALWTKRIWPKSQSVTLRRNSPLGYGESNLRSSLTGPFEQAHIRLGTPCTVAVMFCQCSDIYEISNDLVAESLRVSPEYFH